MKKTLFSLIIILFCYHASAQNISVGSDYFNYNGFTVSHYGLGWYLDPATTTVGPMAYMTAYGGIKFFSQGSPRAIIDFNGNFGIGTLSPDAKLTVNGTIHSKAVLIDLNIWADYVFKPTYLLPALSDVKSYIDQNQHLPEIPSEQEIAKSGLNVGEMNRLLMKKVEELTLYAIENERKDKERDAAKDKLLASLQEQINALKHQQRKPSRAAKH